MKKVPNPSALLNPDRFPQLGQKIISIALRPILYPFVAHWRYDRSDVRLPNPPPAVPGSTDAERMKNALRIMFSVPKEAYLKEEARLKRARARKRARKRPA